MSGIALSRTWGELLKLRDEVEGPRPATMQAAVDTLRSSGEEGMELANVLDEKKTRLVFSSMVAGGFTLNVLNAILIESSFEGATGDKLNLLVTLLAHEARHAQQGFWVDSVLQELHSFQTQWRISQAVGVQLDPRLGEMLKLEDTVTDLAKAQQQMVQMFAQHPASILYAAMSLGQPRGPGALPAAIKQIRAVTRAAAKVSSA